MECLKAQQILEITRDLIAPMPLEQLLHKIVRSAVDLTQTESAGILLYETTTADLRFKVVSLHQEQLFDIPVPVGRSIAGAAFTSGEPVIVPDVRTDPRYYTEIEKLTGLVARSLLAVPMMFKGRCIGVLEVENKRDHTVFGEDDVKCLTALAAQAAIAIENARLMASLEQQIAEREAALQSAMAQKQMLTALYQASAALVSTLDYEEVLDRILEQIVTLVPCDAANVMLVEGNVARVFRGYGYERFGVATTLRDIEFEISQVRGLAIMRETLQPLTIPDVRHSEFWVYSRPEQHWIRSYIGVPVHLRGRLLGYLSVLSATPDFYTDEDALRLESLAQQAAVAIDNAYLYQQAQLEIEERQRAEQELQRHREHLEELVIERTADLQQALAQLEAEIMEREHLIADLRAFSHTVAHDLKNPLTVMMGYSSLLIEALSGASPEAGFAKTLLTTTEKMKHIVEELLLFANVRQAEIVSVPLDMAAIVAEVQMRMMPLLTNTNAQLEVPVAWPVAMGHAAWVEEVWVNYISNALKYGGHPAEGIPPHVVLGYTILDAEFAIVEDAGAATMLTQNLRFKIQKPASKVIFWVRDHGPGISPEAQAQLFVPFSRLETARVPGHGLGLSIVKRIVEKLGGEVGVASERGQGALFYFTLPVEAPTTLEPVPIEPLSTSALAGEQLAALCAAEQLQQFEAACLSGDYAALEKLAADVGAQDERLGEILQQHVRDFDYTALEKLLQQAKHYKENS